MIYGGFVAAVLDVPPAEQTVLRVIVLFTVAITAQGVSIAIARPLLALRAFKAATIVNYRSRHG